MNMKYLKWGVFVFFAGMLVLFLLLPSLIVQLQAEPQVRETAAQTAVSEKKAGQAIAEPKDKPAEEQVIAVYRAEENKVERMALDQYLFGVLSGEMPASFELEALKAQAVAARTYIAGIMHNQAESTLPQGADVTDTVMHQVYQSEGELKKAWGKDYAVYAEKIRRAVSETEDLVLTYHDQPISALFFSTSNGRTENSEEYWKNELPYLRSVPSPWDADTPKFSQEKMISLADFREKLGAEIRENAALLTNVKRTTGGAVASAEIGGKTFTGRAVREKLELASADFSMKWKDGMVAVTTKGYGHQVGMSQYGANEMAKAGKGFREILLHYYTNVTLADGLSFFVEGKL